MISLHKHLLVSTGEEGVEVRPQLDTVQASSKHALSIAYGSGNVSAVAVETKDTVAGCEAFGILGIIDLVSVRYLAVITDREQVAQLHGNAIYTITDVAFVPLSSQSIARGALDDLRRRAERQHPAHGYATDESDHVEDLDDHPVINEQDHKADIGNAPIAAAAKRAARDVKNVGSFAQKWFAKGNTTHREAGPGSSTSTPDGLTPEQQPEVSNTPTDDGSSSSRRTARQRTTIDTYSKRILKNARLYYCSRSFFFSYDYNLSTRWSEAMNETSDTHLCERFEPDFFWNSHLVSSMMIAKQYQYVLPVIQGYVGQRAFALQQSSTTSQTQTTAIEATTDPGKFLLTLISRRSIKRAGLRYLRRGVDEHGNVANYVETEQILSEASNRLQTGNSYSFVQLRGSIPLFFSQSPYSFKPVPQTFGSEVTNREAFRLHFEQVHRRYGRVQAASLVDKHGTESSIGEAYGKTAQWLNETAADEEKIGFEWFDFHKECKGMRFENVSVLLDTLRPFLLAIGWNKVEDNKTTKQQTGVLRTNCMDCLDRTNVTQSSVAGWALQEQIKEIGLSLDLRTDIKSIWFNQLWADNGDAISRQYAGTAALKGDFTRTRKRNWTGALSDFSLTLNRYYNNIFGDYFLQTCIDYLLGYVGPTAFNDFEAHMMTQDYALDVRRVRQDAIDVCIKIVIEDPAEVLIGGWTLSCPSKANTLRQPPFEECVLLLTDAALYFCRYDWSSEKIGSFERVDLADILSIWRGTYITSALGSSETDETSNVGFALYYNTRGTAIVRTNTRSMDNEKAAADQNAGKNEVQKQADPVKEQRRLLAFKMLHRSAFVSKTDDGHLHDEDEGETAKKISNSIADAMITAVRKARGVDHLTLDEVPKVEEKPIVSLADAKKSTGYVESIGYTLKKLVW